MMMDSTFPGNRGMWRAINSPGAAHGVLCVDHRLGSGDDDSVLGGRGEARQRAARNAPRRFTQPKRIAIVGLTVSLLHVAGGVSQRGRRSGF